MWSDDVHGLLRSDERRVRDAFSHGVRLGR
jgi:hypothetical protein